MNQAEKLKKWIWKYSFQRHRGIFIPIAGGVALFVVERVRWEKLSDSICRSGYGAALCGGLKRIRARL